MKNILNNKIGALLAFAVIGISGGAFSNDYEDLSDQFAQTKLDRCLEAYQGTGLQASCDIYK